MRIATINNQAVASFRAARIRTRHGTAARRLGYDPGTPLALPFIMANTTEQDIKQLNSFLRGELSAVETYHQCLEKVENENVRSQLIGLRESHSSRAVLLRNRITSLGGKPVENAGAWGTLTKALEGGAKLFGEATAVSLLEEGEDHGLKDYRNGAGDLSSSERSFVMTTLLPEQQKSHDILSRIDTNL